MPVGADTNVVVLPSGIAASTGLAISERDGPQALNDPTGDITWVRATGNIAGWIATYRPDSVGAPTQHQTQVGVHNPDDALPAEVTLNLEVDNAADSLNRAFIAARNKNNTKFSGATIIDSLGQSDFLRVDINFGGFRLVGGIISSTGTTFLGIGGFTSTRTAVGHYRIDFSPSFKDNPVVLAMAGTGAGNAANQAAIIARSNSSITLVTTDATSTNFVDLDVDFIAIGRYG